MAHALNLAQRGLGRTWPNPAVGCVIVRNDIVLGRGWTQPGGRPHAETMALKQAIERYDNIVGSTAYITLEPCSHYGETPPCAQALIKAGISRVVGALGDVDPRVNGKGYAMLRDAGIKVCQGVMQQQAAALNAGFFKRITQSRPFVTLKLAMTVDGRIATSTGRSRWITGIEARRFVHMLRMKHDGVVIGSGTALADNPDLRIRDLGSSYQPIRIILDRTLAHSPESRLGISAKEDPVWIIHAKTASQNQQEKWHKAGAKLFECPEKNGRLDLTKALQILAHQGITRILSEGGSEITASLLKEMLVDELIQITAGKLIGAEGKEAVGALAIESLIKALKFKLCENIILGDDVLSRWHPLPPQA